MILFNRGTIKKFCAWLYLAFAYAFILYNLSSEVRIQPKPLGATMLYFYTFAYFFAYVIINNFVTEKVISRKTIDVIELLLLGTIFILILSDIIYSVR